MASQTTYEVIGMKEDEFKITEENEKELHTILGNVLEALKDMDEDDMSGEDVGGNASDRMRNICTGSIAMMRFVDLLDALDEFMSLDLKAFGIDKELKRGSMHATLMVKALLPATDKIEKKLKEFDQWSNDE